MRLCTASSEQTALNFSQSALCRLLVDMVRSLFRPAEPEQAITRK